MDGFGGAARCEWRRFLFMGWNFVFNGKFPPLARYLHGYNLGFFGWVIGR
jgi:hypothetical protein